MSGLNKVILIGNLGADPEMKKLDSGRARTTFRIATSEKWTDKSGERQERVEWHRIVAWGKTGELAKEYLSKGRQVCVVGRIQTRKWRGEEGSDRYTTEVIADSVTFLGSRQQSQMAA